MSNIEHIAVIGARVHNLKNIDVKIPRNKLTVITGVSGSGKSSLAFDTIYAEGQRRYMESFSAYARQFIGGMEAPDVEKITGLSPVISIEQKTTNRNPRSTVGTITEVYDFMRLLFARIGEAYSYKTGKKMVKFSETELIANIQEKYAAKKIIVLAPLIRGRKGHYRELFEQIRKQGYLKVRADGELMEIKANMQLDRFKIHDIELVVDRLQVNKDNTTRLSEAIRKSMHSAKGLVMIMDYDTQETFLYSNKLMCPTSGISYEEPSPNTFSFNSPYGSCTNCKGLGEISTINEALIIPDDNISVHDGGIASLGKYRDSITFKYIKAVAEKYKFDLTTPIKGIPKDALQEILHGNEEGKIRVEMDTKSGKKRVYDLNFEGVIPTLERFNADTESEGVRKMTEAFMEKVTCPTCNGSRLKKESLYFKLDNKNIADLVKMDLNSLQKWFIALKDKLNEQQQIIARDILKEIIERLQFLLDVGLSYLSLDRSARTLSGGESQRIRLATQIGSQLQGITYILDEPSIGLHQRDNQKLIQTLQNLVAIGNTVLVVEHDNEIMEQADYIVDLGPGAANLGGDLVAAGSLEDLKKGNTLTIQYLLGEKMIPIPKQRRKGNGKKLILKGAKGNNLKDVNIEFPLGKFICVSGVSGSGKSSLINETLYPILNHHFFKAKKRPLAYSSITGIEHIDKVIEVNQSPIGRTPRSNPATYIGVFSDIRSLFAMIPEAKIRGYKAGRFSFNVKGGRCDVCEGGGMKVVEMNFLPDIYIECERCLGKRYNRETLEIRYKGKSISDVLEMKIDDAVNFFDQIPAIYRKLKAMQEVGLGYIALGQSSTTLSGGEAQRVKLSSELSKKDTGNTFYILDEPTTGLHFKDVQILLDVIQKLTNKGNTVLIIEHNMDVIKTADHIIDIGLEGGEKGGNIIFEGTPEQMTKNKTSHTAPFLKELLN